MTVLLTPMEEQALQAIAHGISTKEIPPTGKDARFQYDMVRRWGEELFGYEWGGASRLSVRDEKDGFFYCPTINRFLGRLRSKGIIQRSDSASASNVDRSWGWWSLTPLGLDYLGIQAV